MRELTLAWSSGYSITRSALSVDEEMYKDMVAGNIFDALDSFFQELITREEIDVDERIKIFHILLPHDIALASTVIQRRYIVDSDFLAEAKFNPEELSSAQDELFEFCVDQDRGLDLLSTYLMDNFCVGDMVAREIPEPLRTKIVTYVRDKLKEAEEKYEEDQGKYWAMRIEEADTILKSLDY